MAVAKRASRGFRAGFVGLGIWLLKSLAKKFKLSYPSTEYIAGKLAESMTSLSSFTPMPGIIKGLLVKTGAAVEKRTKPVSPPLNMPV